MSELCWPVHTLILTAEDLIYTASTNKLKLVKSPCSLYYKNISERFCLLTSFRFISSLRFVTTWLTLVVCHHPNCKERKKHTNQTELMCWGIMTWWIQYNIPQPIFSNYVVEEVLFPQMRAKSQVKGWVEKSPKWPGLETNGSQLAAD